ncbi:hypothetical protein [Cellulomonas triticagri]|uniref:Uncharacterized protein n=1 Tax=Cellulomonas triticagri TaxID=2483352 RepID=A0A3M2JQ46_9CELL|nr:hypothetical protein [Cellulomonas triticagri]RMI12845.1 hypothetical protein EBM89_07015 [Cellulomonas triticagri]
MSAAVLMMTVATSAAAEQGPSADGAADQVARVAPEAGAVGQVTRTGSRLVAEVDGASITVPTATAGEVAITAPAADEVQPPLAALPGVDLENGDVGFSLSLPAEVGPAEAEVTREGRVVYQPHDGDTDVVVETRTDGGVRIQTVSNGPGAQPSTPTPSVKGCSHSCSMTARCR